MSHNATEQLFDIEDDTEAKGPPPIIMGRSELERWQTCPQQAAQVERKLVNTGGELATIGAEVHAIFAEACKARRVDQLRPAELRDLITMRAMQARPDVQPAVIQATKYAVYEFVQILTTSPENGEQRAPEDLIRFDGGDGPMSGQLAADLIAGESTIRLTCELDLMLATPSPEEVVVYDWKSGHKHWTATSVRASFQFQFYAYLVLRNYPSVQRVGVRIFMSAKNETTSLIIFQRKDMFAIEQRIKSAAANFLQFRFTPTADIPTWPELYKCSICDAAMNCPAAFEVEARDDERLVRQLVVIEARAEKIRKVLTAKVRASGDLRFAQGTPEAVAFGTGKPSKPRAKPCGLYGNAGDDDAES